MAYDEGLAERVRECFDSRSALEEKKMFGGLCFMLSGHMCCGIVGDTLMARVGAYNYEASLAQAHASEMDFTGRAMKGMVYVAPAGVEEDHDLQAWIDTCVGFVATLPPK